MGDDKGEQSPSRGPGGFWPDLSAAEWLIFLVLAAALACINIYTTLLVGWADNGSILAVIAAAMVLGGVGRKPTIESLNLGQTIASAGGAVGFAAAQYAAYRMIEPEHDPPLLGMILMFFSFGLVGAIVGSSVRRYLVRYYWPSGTACAVIQTTLAGEQTAESKRPIRLLKWSGGLAALATIPTKISTTAGGGALRSDLVTASGFGIGFDPLPYGVGIIVGPRIGLGIFIGGLLGWKGLGWLTGFVGVPEEQLLTWNFSMAISALTLPTFASLVYAYLFKSPHVVPSGFAPGRTRYSIPPARALAYTAVALLGTLGIALAAQMVFGVSWAAVVAAVALSWPLCVVNGRICGDTDINVAPLIAFVILFVFAVAVGGQTTAVLLPMAIIGAALASMAVDMMQDYRTGYLVDANPTHQTSVQLAGTAVAAVAAVPFLLLLLDRFAIGPDTALPAPGAVLLSTLARIFSGEFEPTGALLTAIIAVSIGGCVFTFFESWPRTRAWVPSLFGIGIGMLLPTPMTNAIFLGAIARWLAVFIAGRGKHGEARDAVTNRAGSDALLIGAAIFAAAALTSVALVLITEIFDVSGIDLFYIATE